ncbi:MAG: thiamine-phosphate kinase [Methylococcaceae bacterium]|nr:thiamine-phosphate kinase [Methylococcaceae bacterium]
MALGEFELIERYFRQPSVRRDVGLGVGDDCALVAPRSGGDLAVTVDTLVAGVHFLADTDPEGLGHKALAVNLSDLAAMGADPAWVTLALTLPQADEAWIDAFSRGFLTLAGRYGAELIGGDTTRGPLSITVQAMGYVPPGGGLLRSGARPGDGIYVTGQLGLAGLGLKQVLGQVAGDSAEARRWLERPEPRIAAGMVLRDLASACIDISDGLAADLGHILERSGVAARIEWEALPLSSCVGDYLAVSGDWSMPLTAGDDYELCFTVPPEREIELARRLPEFDCAVTRIGAIGAGQGLALLRGGVRQDLAAAGYQHFSASSRP